MANVNACRRNPGQYFVEGGPLDGCYGQMEEALAENAGVITAVAAIAIIIMVIFRTKALNFKRTF
jgi:hypothetical protein